MAQSWLSLGQNKQNLSNFRAIISKEKVNYLTDVEKKVAYKKVYKIEINKRNNF